MKASAPKRIHLMIWGLTLLGFALRIFRLGYFELRGDEAFGWFFSSQAIRDIVTQTLRLLEPHPPLDYFLLHFWSQLMGDSEWVIRFTSVFFGVLAVPLIYRLGAILSSEELGIWAAALLALSPYHLLHSQEARMYTISAALGIASSISLITAMRNNRPPAWGAYALLSVLNAYTHYYALFIIAGQSLYWLLLHPRRQWRSWLIAEGTILLLYLPWLLAGWHVLTAYHGNGDSPTFFEMLQRTLIAFSLGGTVPAEVAFYLSPVFALVLLLGLFALLRRRPWAALFVIIYLALPVLAVYLSSLGRPVFNERYLAVAAPPFYIALAAGLIAIPRLLDYKVHPLTYFVPIVILAATCFSLLNYFFEPDFTRNRGWREVATRLSETAGPDDVIIQNYPDPTLWYYYRGPVPHVVLPTARPLDVNALAVDVKNLGERYSRAWFLPYKSPDWDTDGTVSQWLDRHWIRIREERLAILTLREYQLPRTYLGELIPSNAQWEDLIRLRGYEIQPDVGGRTRVKAGESIELTLVWEALQRIPKDYTVFVHFLQTGARPVFQRDNQPVNGTYPTSTWEPGMPIVDQYTVVVPWNTLAGTYSIAVGFYDIFTGNRLRVITNTASDPGRYVLDRMIEVIP